MTTILDEKQQEIDELRASHAELLSLLRMAVEIISLGYGAPWLWDEELADMRAAIKRAEAI
jgi:hypothetical protein